MSQVYFYTNATVFDAIPTGGLNGTGDGVGNGSNNITGSSACEAVRGDGERRALMRRGGRGPQWDRGRRR